ncbi:carbohydrate ABC transporter permease [Paenibacillus sp. PAMC21692]|uniref:carbohydrate ABC transporter permease n=1 Tax=Paenibacillus sp. PAMC21692 TaxID=2762320 RepID=UPI00164E7849|nr:carbohydrate ABC transporter permease [Paenibacillus sp. PAMC21692]QNK56442.1 carbohydrate ABC transporter permease [Paenibacillus sp. PAMC21692]
MILTLRKLRFNKVMLLMGLTALAAFMMLPIVFLFNHAFKPLNELFLFPPRFLVSQPTSQNFERLWSSTSGDLVPFTRYLFNSMLVVVATLIAVVAVSTMAAYALAKFKFHFRTIVMALIYVSLMFAAETVQIPRYLIISGIGVSDTYFAHILPFIAAPVSVFLLIQFITQIPDSLLEAAKIDGAKQWTLFTRIVIPLTAPAIATVAILTFQASWGDVEASTLFIHEETLKTLPYYVQTLGNAAQNVVSGQGMMAAAGLLLFIPNLLVFLLFQNRVMETMVSSGIKE